MMMALENRDNETLAFMLKIRRELYEKMNARAQTQLSDGGAQWTIRNVSITADRMGLSGEDRYALLSHELLAALEEAHHSLLEHINLHPSAGSLPPLSDDQMAALRARGMIPSEGDRRR